MISALTPWCIRKHLYLMKNGRHKAPSDFPRAAKCRPGSRGDGHAARQGAAGLLATAATDGPGKAVHFISPISPRPWPGEPRAVGSFQGSQLRVLSPRVRPDGPSQTPASPTQDQPVPGLHCGTGLRDSGSETGPDTAPPASQRGWSLLGEAARQAPLAQGFPGHTVPDTK